MAQYTVFFYPVVVVEKSDSDVDTAETDGEDQAAEDQLGEEGKQKPLGNARFRVCELCGWTMRATDKRCPQCKGVIDEGANAVKPADAVIKTCEYCGWMITTANSVCPQCRHAC